jgi:aldehyde dehydrogenase (NAD+)
MNMQARISHSDKPFIGGQWVDAASATKVEVLNAATEEPFARLQSLLRRMWPARSRQRNTAFDQGHWPTMLAQERAGYLVALI